MQGPTRMPDSQSPTPQEAPVKEKKKTPTEVKKELEDLQRVSAARMVRLRDLEAEKQKAKDILKREGTPGMTIEADHYRMAEQIKQLRKLLDVKPEEISSGV